MFPKPSVECPVCKEKLGYLTRGEVCSFVCKECQWVFVWGRDGKMKKPIKLDDKKPQICGCEGCKYRDEQNSNKIFKR